MDAKVGRTFGSLSSLRFTASPPRSRHPGMVQRPTVDIAVFADICISKREAHPLKECNQHTALTLQNYCPALGVGFQVPGSQFSVCMFDTVTS